ncbi:hypothetical protein FQN53_008426 [Emmonsiellopsis sp. PD_33]|nr:hypothetical protein FQN53_008426 [Emmonsiellopsis sp. PD_33]
MSTLAGTSSPGSPWQVAYDRLNPELKASLVTSSLTGSRLNVLSAVLDEAERKKKLCLQKRWKIRLHGQTIILRDVFDKIIVWVNEYKSIGDVAMQYDAHIAALPWAGVRFLLQAALNDHHCFESTIHGLESVSLMITRYAAFEALYMRRGSLVSSELQTKLIGLYTKILIFLANGVKYFSQSAAVRMLKSVFQSTQDNELREIAEDDKEVGNLARIFDTQVQQDIHSEVERVRQILETLQSPITRSVDASTVYAKTMKEQQFQDLLKWLSPVPFSHHHARHSGERLRDSTGWLLGHPQYASWKASSSSSLLLLHGVPGCGKTSLVSAVVDAFLDEKNKNPLAAPVMYFYCGDSRVGRGRADPDEIMRSLIRQLAVIDKTEHKVHEEIQIDYERREALAKLDGFEVPWLRSSDCADLILKILGNNPATIVIDGVDEVEQHRRHTLLESLIRVRDESSSVIKIFLSSRDDSNIFARLPDAVMLRVQETNTRQDMELFVKYRVSTAIKNRNLLDGNVPPSLEDGLVKFLLDRAGEMFLWVHLQMERLCELKSRSSVSEAMQERSKVTTATLDYLYREVLDDMSTKDSVVCDISKRAFSWLMFKPLDLTLPELFSICSNLLVLDSNLDTVRFAHSSFKEFLEARPEFDIVRAHGVAAISCLDICIHQPSTDLGNELHPEREFGLYAALYWPTHCSEATVNGVQDSDLNFKLTEFAFYDDETSLPFLAWLDAAQRAADLLANGHVLKKELNAVISSTMSPLFTACVYGLESLFQVVANRDDFDKDLRNSLDHTGLYLAAAFGRHKIVHDLLERGADMNIQCGKHRNALNAAAFGGHLAVVQHLLRRMPLTQSPSALESALDVSFLAGQEHIAKVLLVDGIKITCQDDYDKVYAAAAQAGFSEVLQYLTKCFPSFCNTKSPSSKTLEAAISRGQLAFLSSHIKPGLLIDHPVATAALYGQTEIALLFLNERFGTEEEGPFGTPLRTACLMGHEPVARMLLERGANVNASGTLGDALQAAAMKGHLSITNLLLQYKADVNSNGGYYGTALQAAAYRGHYEVAKTLIDSGSWIECGGRYKDAFHAAAEAGQESIVGIFLDKGYRFHKVANYKTYCFIDPSLVSVLPYRNLLGEAWRGERKPLGGDLTPDSTLSLVFPISNFHDIFKEAQGTVIPETHELQAPYQRQRRSLFSMHALAAAAARGHGKVVQHILERGKMLGVDNGHVGEALCAASKNGDDAIVELIISAEVDLQQWYIENALEHAAERGHMVVLERLLKYVETRGLEDRHIKGSSSLTYRLSVVLAGCRGNQPAIVTRGLQLVPDTERQEMRGTALQEACISNSMNVIDVLFYDWHVVEPDVLRQAYQAAVKHGSKSALVRLVEKDHDKCLHFDCNPGAFVLAVMQGHTEIVQYFAEHGIPSWNPDITNKTFVEAAYKGYLDIMKLLISVLKKCESYRTILDEALNGACAAGHRAVAEYLTLAGANVNASVGVMPKFCGWTDVGYRMDPTSLGSRTPLQACLQAITEWSRKNYPDSSSTARIFRQNRDGVVMRQESIIKLLLENGANVNLFAEGEMTPLHSAVLNCTEEIVRAMIERGANVHALVPKYGTPLQCAASREVESLRIVRVLLDAGAETTDEDSRERPSNSILNAALSNFGANDGYFIQADSLQEVLTTGPGGVIKLILQSRQELQANDKRFSLVLQMAAAAGDEDFVQLLIDRKVDVNLSGHHFGNALQAAARFGHLNCVHQLLEAGADVNMVGGSHETPLRAAVGGTHSEVVRALLNQGADVNLCSDPNTSLTAIQLAVQSKSLDIARLLISAGAQIGPVSPIQSHVSYYEQPLITACGHGNVEMVEVLLSSGADVNISGTSHSYYTSIPYSEASPLHKACAGAKEDIVQILLKRGVDLEKRVDDCPTPLAAAAMAGHLGIIEQLLKAGAAIYDPPRTPNVLIEACKSKKAGAVIEFLLQKLSNPSTRMAACEEALSVAQQSGDEMSFTLILRQLPKTTSILSKACMFGSKDDVEWILAQGIDVDSDLDNGGRALHLAAYYQRPVLIPLLLQKGANICYVSPKYGTPMSAAFEGLLALRISKQPYYLLNEQLLGMLPEVPARRQDSSPLDWCDGSNAEDHSCEQTVRMLLRFGAGVNPAPRALRVGPPLHLASYAGSLSLVQLCLEKGADINATGGYFGSALIAAICGDHPPVIKLLLGKGINVNIFSPVHGTALHCARQEGSQWLRRILLDLGAWNMPLLWLSGAVPHN